MYISNLKRSVDSMRAGQKLEHSVGHVIVGVIGVVIEGDAQTMSRTIRGLSGSGIILSGCTAGEDCNCDQ